MSESESDALPLGDTPIFGTSGIIANMKRFVNSFLKNFFVERIFWAKTLSSVPPCGIISPLRGVLCAARTISIYPWLSWIARQTPTLKVEGSNPFG